MKDRKSLNNIIKILADNRERFARDFGVTEMAVFGSYARGEQKRNSDIDIAVKIKMNSRTFDNFMELKFSLEKLLGNKVDLVTQNSIRKEIKKQVLEEAVHV